MKHTLKLAAVLLALGFNISCSRSPGFKSQILFETVAPDTIPYRIPAMALLDDGSLLALADYRYCKLDIGFGRVDIHSRVSRDEGRSWSKESVVISGTGVPGAVDCGFGDPAVVADSESGEILLMMVCGETVYWHATTNRRNPNRVAVLRSSDNGRTWSAWEEATESVYSLFDASVHGCVESCFVASGKIFQSRCIKVGSHYRIYAALCARPNGNRVIYSDDFGHTWSALGGPDCLPATGGDEPKCEELPDGRVVLSSRAYGGRIFNIYTYTDIKTGEGCWDDASFSGFENNGCTALENTCNGEVLILPVVRRADGEEVFVAFQSVPLGPGRSNVGIYYKEIVPSDVAGLTSADLAAGWQPAYQVSALSSAYSTMIQQRNGHIAFFYEEAYNESTRGFDLVYKEIPVEVITAGAYESRLTPAGGSPSL
ncbi:MAG: exo-alpha-sialidase [Bacteroidales bacterium]|nr:exo-alpha-sialidase [Bacteroidales bacterium]